MVFIDCILFLNYYYREQRIVLRRSCYHRIQIGVLMFALFASNAIKCTYIFSFLYLFSFYACGKSYKEIKILKRKLENLEGAL
jgi:hypothetical protein